MFWIYIIPKWRRYCIRAEVVRDECGAVASHRLVQVPVEDIPEWDRDHDEAGELRFRETVAWVQRAELTESASGGGNGYTAGDALSVDK